MIALRRWRDPLALIAIVLVAWQVLYWFAGEVALTAPWPTIQQLASMLGNARFLPHVQETLLAFAQGFAIAIVAGLGIGTLFGSQRGLGFLLLQAMSVHNIKSIMAITLLLVIFAASVNALLLGVERRLRERG